MLYNKIRADFKYGPKGRFYRIFLVKEGINLFDFCVGLGTMLGAAFEHCFLITLRKENKEYVMAPFLEERYGNTDYRYLRNYTLNILPDNFDFEYDTGDGWDFSCKKYKKFVQEFSEENFILLEGAGMGIWEDNVGSLYALFEGKVDPNQSEPDEENGYYFPWNFQIEKFGDFDKKLDIKSINEELSWEYIDALDQLKENENEFIEETGVDVSL